MRNKIINLYLKGWGAEQIAEHLKISIGNVNSIFGILRDEHYELKKKECEQRLVQIKNIERRLFDAIEQKSPDDYIDELTFAYCVALLVY